MHVSEDCRICVDNDWVHLAATMIIAAHLSNWEILQTTQVHGYKDRIIYHLLITIKTCILGLAASLKNAIDIRVLASPDINRSKDCYLTDSVVRSEKISFTGTEVAVGPREALQTLEGSWL